MEVWEESLPFKAEEAKEGSRYALRRRRGRARAADGTDERDDDDDGAVAYFRGGAGE